MKPENKLQISWITNLLIFLISNIWTQTIDYEIIENDVYDRNIFIRAVGLGDIIGENPDRNFYGSWGYEGEAHFIKLVTARYKGWFGLTDSLSGSFSGYDLGGDFHISDKEVDATRRLFLDRAGDMVYYIDAEVKKRRILSVRGGIYSVSVGNYYSGEFDGEEQSLGSVEDTTITTTMAEGLSYALNGLYIGISYKTFFGARVSTSYDEYIRRIPRQTNHIYLDILLGGGELEGSWVVTSTDATYPYDAIVNNYVLGISDSEKYYSWKSMGWRVGFDINRYQAFGRWVGISYFGEIGMRPGLEKDALYGTLGIGLGFAL